MATCTGHTPSPSPAGSICAELKTILAADGLLSGSSAPPRRVPARIVNRCRRVSLAMLATERLAEQFAGLPTEAKTARVVRLSQALRDVLHNGDIGIRRAYLRMFVDQIVISGTEIRFCGPTAALAAAASADQLPDITMVPSFVPEWRARRDSNPRPQD
jgi:hypothetical protein